MPRTAVAAAHLAADDPGRVLDALTYGSPDRPLPRRAVYPASGSPSCPGSGGGGGGLGARPSVTMSA